MATIALVAGLAAAAGLFLLCYYFGHHNIHFSRSYFLEKDIRNLRHRETHGMVDYGLAAEAYESFLARIRFDERVYDFSGQYRRAIERTRMKQGIVELLEAYRVDGDVGSLRRAGEVFGSSEFREFRDRHSGAVMFRGERLTDAWFRKRLEEAENTERVSGKPVWREDSGRVEFTVFPPRETAPKPWPLATLFFVAGASMASGLYGFGRIWRAMQSLGL